MEDDMADPGTSRDDGEIGLPKGTVNKMFKDMLGPEFRCTNEAHALLHTCLNEFLQNLTAQANAVSTEEKKNTITEAHLLKALKDLDFQHFATQVEASQPPAAAPAPKRKNKAKDSGLSQEELLRMQQELFAESRQKMATAAAPIT